MMRTLTPITSILIAILLTVFFIQPEYEKTLVIQKETEEYKKAEQKYGNFASLLEQKLSLKTNRSAYESEKLDTLIPERIDSAQLIVDLEKLAGNQNMLFGNIAVDGEDTVAIAKRNDSDTQSAGQKSRYGEVVTTDISFELIGTYEQFKNFLKDLEVSLTMFEVTNIHFATTDDIFQQFAVTVRVYALPLSE